MSRFRWYGPTLVLLITTLGIMFATPALIRSVTWAGTNATITTIRNDLDNNPSLVELSDAFKQVARAVEPSVVHIEIQSKSPSRERMSPQPMPRNPFDKFFEQPSPQFRDAPRRSPNEDGYSQYNSYRPVANGSGWIYRHAGQQKQPGNYIITNAHVVADVGNTERIQVTFHDGRNAYATVVGTDPKTDIAVLELSDSDSLHPAEISQNPVQQGEIVFAFGSPFGAMYSFSMSQGIVSAVGRRVGIIGNDSYENFIQTDAAINPGNSGGPLANTRGQIIGMNTAIASRTGSYNGIGFAIPATLAADIADRLITDGSVQRGFLGVEIGELTDEWADAFGYDGRGVLVNDVLPGGAAETAGMQPGDIITAVDGKSIKHVRDLRFRVADLPPGQSVALSLFRAGEPVTLDVTLGRRNQSLAVGHGEIKTDPDHADHGTDDERLLRYGIIGAEAFTQAAARRNNVEHIAGILVTAVRPGSAAASPAVRLERGSIITHIFDTPVANITQLIEAINASDPDRPVRLTIKTWNPKDQRYRQRFSLLRLD